ncbi:MAG TPA: hypothetical protein VIM17_11640 [Jatrophihabitantaceae bacterium]
MIDSGMPAASALRRRTPVIAGLLIAVMVAGCSSSTSKPASRSGVQVPTGTDVASGVNDAAATAITTAYIRFFDSTVAQAQKLGLIQDGAEFSQAISQESTSEFTKSESVQVTKVGVNSANKATVIFTVVRDGSPALANQTGYAVLEDGRWKVAGATFCNVLATQGAVPPVCKTLRATTLPG